MEIITVPYGEKKKRPTIICEKKDHWLFGWLCPLSQGHGGKQDNTRSLVKTVSRRQNFFTIQKNDWKMA